MLPLAFYRSTDTLAISHALIGKFLMTCIDGKTTGGMIVETEAYLGPGDRASHAYCNKRTKRNEIMYAAGGVAYVYLCHGIHALFNIVTNKKDEPHAVLIRAIKPEIGISTMLERRNKKQLTPTLTSGPGTLTQALGIHTVHNKTSLLGPLIWLEDRGIVIPEVLTTPRIGIDYAGEDVLKPWRFVAKGY